MPDVGKIYECAICGNTVKIIVNGNTPLVCCGQVMDKIACSEEEFLKNKDFLKSEDL